MGYVAISLQVGVHWNTVRRWVRDIDVSRDEAIAAHVARRAKPTDELRCKAALRRRLMVERGHRCERCGLSEWLGEPIALETHRLIPSVGYRSHNVHLLCPNCHSLTVNWRGRGKLIQPA